MVKQSIFLCGIALLAATTNVSAQESGTRSAFLNNGNSPNSAIFQSFIDGQKDAPPPGGYEMNTGPQLQEDISTSTVPEPGTVALVATGLVGLGAAYRRRKAVSSQSLG